MLTELTAGATLGVLGALSSLTSLIVELIKDLFPKIPTKIITLIVSIIVCLTYAIMEKGFILSAFIFGFFGGFIVAYAAMNGFDTIRDIGQRLSLKNGGADDE